MAASCEHYLYTESATPALFLNLCVYTSPIVSLLFSPSTTHKSCDTGNFLFEVVPVMKAKHCWVLCMACSLNILVGKQYCFLLSNIEQEDIHHAYFGFSVLIVGLPVSEYHHEGRVYVERLVDTN